jgi:hypothetical protein
MIFLADDEENEMLNADVKHICCCDNMKIRITLDEARMMLITLSRENLLVFLGKKEEEPTRKYERRMQYYFQKKSFHVWNCTAHFLLSHFFHKITKLL